MSRCAGRRLCRLPPVDPSRSCRLRRPPGLRPVAPLAGPVAHLRRGSRPRLERAQSRRHALGAVPGRIARGGSAGAGGGTARHDRRRNRRRLPRGMPRKRGRGNALRCRRPRERQYRWVGPSLANARCRAHGLGGLGARLSPAAGGRPWSTAGGCLHERPEREGPGSRRDVKLVSPPSPAATGAPPPRRPAAPRPSSARRPRSPGSAARRRPPWPGPGASPR